MKFKALLSDFGVNLLDRRILPALEKMGKAAHVLLTPQFFFLLHNVLTSDGVQAVSQLCKEILFESYTISSQNNNIIAFTVDLSLLSRALRSFRNMDGERLQVKLVRKKTSASEQALPYLSFESKGFRSAIIQDVPISAPFSRTEAQQLHDAVFSAQELPETLLQLPDLPQLQTFIERLKNVDDTLHVAVTRMGQLHLRVATAFVSIGTEFEKLKVVGERADGSEFPTETSSRRRLEVAVEQGLASVVSVSIRHLLKCLHLHLTKPVRGFCGVSRDETCLFFMFEYQMPSTPSTEDEPVSVWCRVPVLEQQ